MSSKQACFASASSLLLLCGLLAGCTGPVTSPGTEQSHDSATGAVRLQVAWPDTAGLEDAQARLIPAASQSIKIEFILDDQVIRDGIIAQPQTSMTFLDLPATTLLLRASAYPEPDASGTAQAQGQKLITVLADQETEERLTLGSTIVSVEIAPNPATVALGQTAGIISTALDVEGSTVLVAGPWAWQVSDEGIAQVDASGVVSGLYPGTVDVIATEPETDISGAGVVRVVDAPPAGNEMRVFVKAALGRQVTLGGLTIEIPPNALTQDGYIRLVQQEPTPENTAGIRIMGHLTAPASDITLEDTQLIGTATLSFAIPEELRSSSGFDPESGLAIAYWNGSEWEALPTTYESSTGALSAETTHLSIFAPIPDIAYLIDHIWQTADVEELFVRWFGALVGQGAYLVALAEGRISDADFQVGRAVADEVVLAADPAYAWAYQVELVDRVWIMEGGTPTASALNAQTAGTFIQATRDLYNGLSPDSDAIRGVLAHGVAHTTESHILNLRDSISAAEATEKLLKLLGLESASADEKRTIATEWTMHNIITTDQELGADRVGVLHSAASLGTSSDAGERALAGLCRALYLHQWPANAVQPAWDARVNALLAGFSEDDGDPQPTITGISALVQPNDGAPFRQDGILDYTQSPPVATLRIPATGVVGIDLELAVNSDDEGLVVRWISDEVDARLLATPQSEAICSRHETMTTLNRTLHVHIADGLHDPQAAPLWDSGMEVRLLRRGSAEVVIRGGGGESL